MTLHRNRYNPASLLAQLDAQVPSRDADEWCLRFTCFDERADIDDFVAYLPRSEAEHLPTIEILRDFLSRIAELDNLVQESFEIEWTRCGGHVRNHQLHVAYLSPADGVVAVEYFGTIVNTQCTATFKRASSGEWTVADRRGLYP